MPMETMTSAAMKTCLSTSITTQASATRARDASRSRRMTKGQRSLRRAGSTKLRGNSAEAPADRRSARTPRRMPLPPGHRARCEACSCCQSRLVSSDIPDVPAQARDDARWRADEVADADAGAHAFRRIGEHLLAALHLVVEEVERSAHACDLRAQLVRVRLVDL